MSIEELETLRKKARKIVIIGAICTIVGMIIFTPIGIVALIITIIKSSKAKKEFSLAYKGTYVLKALQSVFTDLIYEPEKGIAGSVIRNTEMMYMGDRYTSNDYISARYKNIQVVQADVHIEEKHTSTDSDGDTSTDWVTIFKGKWMIFDFNKNFKANIQVSEKGFRNSKISNWGKELKYKKVMLEDQLFNEQFKTYAQNEHEAFYILTPSLMERIKSLSNAIDGKLLLCFVDNKLHVGIHNGKDSFEHGLFKEMDENKAIAEIEEDIRLITSFVDGLSLENDLFRKEV